MQSGSTVHVSGLTLQPSTAITLTNTTLQRNTATVANFSVPYIQRVYQFTNVTDSFKGTIRFNYADSELNNISESILSLGIYNANTWSTFTPTTRDTAGNIVVTSGLTGIRLNELTLANPIVVPSVSIGASALSVCEGSTVNFTATPVNGGSTPAYQWKRNGVNVGTNSDAYTANDFSNGDVISCIMTSNDPNAVPATATSNSITLTVKAKTNSITNISECTSYSWNGNTYTSSGTYSYVTTNAAGCDSTAILNLTIKSTSSSTTTTSSCTSYSWNGNTYTSNGTYSYVTTNAAGCDSIATLNLTIKSTSSSTSATSSCTSYSWNGNTYTSSGTYSYVATNAAGCDSTAILNLTIKSTSSSTTTTSSCTSYSWNGNIYTSSGTYSYVTTNAAGCDSTATLNLTIKSTSSSTSSISSCTSYSWNGNTYTSSGTYSYVTTNAAGCDSTAILNLTIKSTSSSTTTTSSCTSYSWNGNTYTSSGTYSYVTTNAAGCDSTATLNLTIAPIANPVISITQPGCSGTTGTITVTSPLGTEYTYSIGGNYQASPVFGSLTPGTYTVSVKNTTNCTASLSGQVVNSQSGIPAKPGVISGTYNVCKFIGTNTALQYSIAPVTNASSYLWSIPSNATILSGQGTNVIMVQFLAGYAANSNKQIRVSAVSACATSAATIFHTTAQRPVTPGFISASTTNVCPSLGTNVPIIFKIKKVSSASSYIWSAQSGTTSIVHPNGLGENDTVIAVTFATNFSSSNIIVQSVNNCGVSAVRGYPIFRNTTSAPCQISGPTNVCEYIGSNGLAATYSVSFITGAVYNWIIPVGATNVNGQGTNVISFKYPAGYTGGSISFSITNGCGTSAIRSLSVNVLRPATPGAIDIINTQNCPNRQYSYSVSCISANATQMLWTFPSEATLVSGQGTRTITLSYPSGVVSGVITVSAISNCGQSSVRSCIIKLAPCPSGVTTAPTGKNTLTSNEDWNATVFPNPSTTSFHLQLKSAEKQSASIFVRDASGRTLKQYSMGSYESLQFGNELLPGVYWIEVGQGRRKKVVRVVKY
jgi:hypothetical protein